MYEDGIRESMSWARDVAGGHPARRVPPRARRPKGDRVALYMPMCPAVAVASNACAHIGAVQVPIFSGFAAPAVASRLEDSQAKVIICADWSLRRGKRIEMTRHARRGGNVRRRVRDRVEPGDAFMAGAVTRQPGVLPPVEVDSEAPYLLAYTSGTTGRPKGALHVQGGFLVSIAREVAYQTNVKRGDAHALRDRHGLDHGPVDRRRRRRGRRDDRLRRGRSRLARRPDLAARRVGAGDDARRFADARPRARPEGRAEREPLVAADVLHDGRAVEPRSVHVALRAGRRRARADREHQRRHRGRCMLPHDGASPSRSSPSRSGSRRSGRTWTSSTRSASVSARRRSASSSAAGRGPA